MQYSKAELTHSSPPRCVGSLIIIATIRFVEVQGQRRLEIAQEKSPQRHRLILCFPPILIVSQRGRDFKPFLDEQRPHL
jgi:hypothetical protein